MELPPLSQWLLIGKAGNTEVSNVLLERTSLPQGTPLLAKVEGTNVLSDGLRQSVLHQLSQATTGQNLPEKLLAYFASAQRLYMVLLNTEIDTRLIGTEQLASLSKTQMEAGLRIAAITPLQLPARTPLMLVATREGQLELVSAPQSLRHQSNPTTATMTTQSRHETLQQGLRDYVAFSEPLRRPQTLLVQLERQLSALPVPLRDSLFSRNEQALLTALTGPRLTAPSQVTPRYIAQRIEHSGHFLEATLRQANDPQYRPAVHPTAETNRIQAPSPDAKQQLLQVYEFATTALHPTDSATSGRKAVVGTLAEVLQRAAASLRQNDVLMAQLQNLAAQKKSSPPTEDLRQRLHNTLRAAAALGIARITANQLQQLAGGRQEAAGATPTHVEFVIRIQEQIIPVNLWIQEKFQPDPETDEGDRKRKAKKKARVWRLFMELELQDDGKFASEVCFSDEKIHTRVWTETDRLQRKTERKLDFLKDKLAASGINVEQIILEPGPPPRQDTNLRQQLIDIKT